MSQFKAGTVVKLKSGGPKMTCSSEPSDYGEVRCQWFAGSKLEYGDFPVETLVLVDEDDNGSDKGKKK